MEKSAQTYSSIVKTHEKSEDLKKNFQELRNKLLALNVEQEVVEKRRREAMKKCAQLELDEKHIQERISWHHTILLEMAQILRPLTVHITICDHLLSKYF